MEPPAGDCRASGFRVAEVVSDDRFEDLGAKRPAPQPSAAERLSDLDDGELEEERPSPPPPQPARPGGGRYAWVVGVALLIVIVVAGVNSIPNAGRGVRGPAKGELIPAFAAPGATAGVDGDANVAQAEDADGRAPACRVREPGAVNICDLRARSPLVVTFIVPGVPECEAQLDRVERLRGEFPGVGFVAVVSGRPRSEVAPIVRRRGWRFPVAVDRDLAVFNLYRIGFCPTTVFSYRGGEVREARVKEAVSDGELRAAVRSLVRSQRARDRGR